MFSLMFLSLFILIVQDVAPVLRPFQSGPAPSLNYQSLVTSEPRLFKAFEPFSLKLYKSFSNSFLLFGRERTALPLCAERGRACDLRRKSWAAILHLLAERRTCLDSLWKHEVWIIPLYFGFVIRPNNFHHTCSCSRDRSDHAALVMNNDIIIIGGGSHNPFRPLANGEMVKSELKILNLREKSTYDCRRTKVCSSTWR